MAKDRGALVALLGLGGGKKSDPAEPADGARYSKGKEPDEDDVEPDEDDYDADFASFAESAGIPPAKRARAEAALKRFVMACKGSSDTEE